MAHVEFRPATVADAHYIGARLRRADQEEIRALGEEPEAAAVYCVVMSDYAWTGLIDGEPSMIFGCTCPLLEERGDVWALGTDKCTAAPRDMLKYGRSKIKEMLGLYPKLGNYCDARYTAAHRWLRKLGFNVQPPEPYGPKRALFCRITIDREE